MSSVKKTNEQFLEDLYRLNEYYRRGDFTVVDEYVKAIVKIKVDTEFGLCHITPNSLLSNRNPCTSQSAVDKDDYIKRVLLKHNKSYREGFFTITSEFKSWKSLIEVETLYGKCILTTASLYAGSKPGIDSAVDKTSYWLNYAKDRNTKYDGYTYENVIINGTDDMVNITCKKHGSFTIKGNNFTSKNQGCKKCFDETRAEVYKDNGGWHSKDWIKSANKSKYFDSFKMYIIRCWNDEEEFYKVGRTFLTVSRRFKDKKEMPYNWEIIQIRKSEDGHKIYCLEKVFKRINKENSYKPKSYFKGGHTECFTKIIDINNGKEIS